MDAPIVMQCLGGFRIQRGERVARFSTRKAAALFAFLAYFPDRGHPRDTLIEQLWPEARPDAGRKSLRVALSAIRQALAALDLTPDPVLQSDHFTVRLEKGTVDVDAHRFRAAVERGLRPAPGPEQARELERALDLYSGPLLPGVDQEWVATEQLYLSELASRTLQLLIRLHADAGNLAQAVRFARRAVLLNPFSEPEQRLLIRLLVDAGDTAGALRQYDELEEELRRELRAAPSAETRALIAGLRGTSAPSHAALPSRLPRPWNPFFGREQEKAWLLESVRQGESRLITVTGMGGAGKTRLALEVAAAVEADWPDRVWFVPLAEVRESRLIPEEVSRVLGIATHPDEDPLAAIAAHLSGSPALVVLDNLEHLIDEGAAVVRRLLESAPDLTCLVTSRQRLRLRGEQQFRLDPLPVPAPGETLPDVGQSPSLQLFAARARAVRAEFRLTSRNLPEVHQLCQALEGIPLAIELAAARCGILTPGQILRELRDGWSWLVSREQDAPERHRSVTAAIEWSYLALPPGLQRFFAGLSTFRGGWTLVAAAAVCGLADGTGSVLDSLAHLQEASLIHAREERGEMRFGMLELLRAFAERRLPPELALETRRRHAEWSLQRARELAAESHAPDEAERLDRMEQELPNFEAALEFCAQPGGDVLAGLRLGSALNLFWRTRGYLSAGVRHMEELLDRPEAATPTTERENALSALGAMWMRVGDHQRARPLLEESLALGDQLQTPGNRQFTLFCLGALAFQAGDYDTARRNYEQFVVLKRELGERPGTPLALLSLGTIARLRGEYEAARRWYGEAVAMAREMEDRRCTGSALDCLGLVAQDEGDLLTARRLGEEALRMRRALGDPFAVAASLNNRALVELRSGDMAAARVTAEEALVTRQGVPDDYVTALLQTTLGRVALREGRFAEAVERLRDALRLAWGLKQQVPTLQALLGLAGACASAGNAGTAARLWAGAEAQMQSHRLAVAPVDRGEFDAWREAARTALGEEAWQREWDAGRNLSLEELVALALHP